MTNIYETHGERRYWSLLTADRVETDEPKLGSAIEYVMIARLICCRSLIRAIDRVYTSPTGDTAMKYRSILPTIATIGALIAFAASSLPVRAQGCLEPNATGATFQSISIVPQRGQFTFEADATPALAGSAMDGGLVLSDSPLSGYPNIIAAVRFNQAGTVDAKYGSGYSALTSYPYTAGQQYRIRMSVNVPQGTYSATVRKVPGGPEAKIAENFPFRNPVDALSWWGAFSDYGHLTACNAAAYSTLYPQQVRTFDGARSFIEIPDSDVFSLATTGALTFSIRFRPDALRFGTSEASGYVHIMGKGAGSNPEWALRMYSLGNTEQPTRDNRISVYVFEPGKTYGAGTYLQEQITPGEWIHVVGVFDGTNVYIYRIDRDGVVRKNCSQYRGTLTGACQKDAYYPITPVNGSAPVRIGSRNLTSFFLGAIYEVRFWNRALSSSEVLSLHNGSVPQQGLVAEYPLTSDVAIDTKGGRNGAIYMAPMVPR